MKIKRFFAPDMRQAIRKVRGEQGPDAVILSSRRVPGGIEIISAVDYDESLISEALQQTAGGEAKRQAHAAPTVKEEVVENQAAGDGKRSADPSAAILWAQDPALVEMRRELKMLRGLLEDQLSRLAWSELARRHPLKADLLRRFTRLGLSPELANEVSDAVRESEDAELAWRQALGELARRIPVTDDDILTHGGVVALVGPTGVGKTTTVAKLAARFALRHGQRHVALVTTDSYRIGAQEQLITFGRILGVPVQVAGSRDELGAVLQGLMDKKLVLIDTAGMSQRDLRLTEQFGALTGTPLIKTYLVISANTQRASLDEVVRTFGRVRLDGCILTKLDEAASLGDALSVIVRHRLAVAYLGDGQRVPEDMHPARPHSLVSRAVSLMERDERPPGDEALAVSFGKVASHAHV